MNTELRKIFLKPISVSSHSLNRDSWKRRKEGNSARLQFCKTKSANTPVPKERRPHWLQPVAANSVQRAMAEHGTRIRTPLVEEKPYVLGSSPAEPKANNRNPGFHPAPSLQLRKRVPSWHEAKKYVGTASNNSKSLAEVSAERRRAPRL